MRYASSLSRLASLTFVEMAIAFGPVTRITWRFTRSVTMQSGGRAPPLLTSLSNSLMCSSNSSLGSWSGSTMMIGLAERGTASAAQLTSLPPVPEEMTVGPQTQSTESAFSSSLT
eukprot:Amastigsp_a515655_29.p3 type:complete len:115 gc:universal Amastigsp_a515655_29:605-261(-)